MIEYTLLTRNIQILLRTMSRCLNRTYDRGVFFGYYVSAIDLARYKINDLIR